MDNRLTLTDPPDGSSTRRRPRRPPARRRSNPWRMSDEARRTGRQGIAMARRELQRVRAHHDAAVGADAA